jgi:hypothetical protein
MTGLFYHPDEILILDTKRLSENTHLLRFPHPRPVEFSLRETAQPIQQGKSLRRTSMYASFLRISDALHLGIFHQPPKYPVLRQAPS